MHEMLKRAAVTQACMDRFVGKPLDWKARHCGKLAAHAMHGMGRSAKLLNACRATTAKGAALYLKRTGFASLVDLMDAQMADDPASNIPAAAARPGDIIAMQSFDGDPFGCSLAVALDNGRILGFLDGVCQVLQPHDMITGWRL